MLRKRKWNFSLLQFILVTVMLFLTLTMIVPLINLVAVSFSDPKLSPTMTGLDLLPKGFSLINYQIILSNPVMVPALFNSIFITVVGTLINIFMTALAAYALTRPNLVGKRVFMVFFIIMMLFDPGLVPEYLTVRELGLMGSQWSVILVMAVNVYYLVIMMRYFEEVPVSICEAAKIDGAGHLRILCSIIMPLSKAGIATLTMFYGVVRWNEYIRAGLYISKIRLSPLQVILRKFIVQNDIASIIGHQNVLNYNELAKIDYGALQFATIVVAIIPILLVYPLVLKYYTKDVMAGGVKE